MGGGKLNMVVVLMLMVAATLYTSSMAQTTHVVGDSTGWTIPSAPTFYSNWASGKTFAAGDILVFNFPTGVHDVAEVTKLAFDSCSSTGPISLSTSGPTRITLSSAGEHHYICTFGTHCSFGQKLAINVSAAATSPPAPQPATPPPTATPPPAVATPPPAVATPPPAVATPPSPAPSPVATPPPSSTPAPAPSPVTTPPSSTGTPAPTPSPVATPPSGSTPAPSSTATPPGSTTTPPGTESANGPTAPPPPPLGSGTAFHVAALPLTVFSVAVALLY